MKLFTVYLLKKGGKILKYGRFPNYLGNYKERILKKLKRGETIEEVLQSDSLVECRKFLYDRQKEMGTLPVRTKKVKQPVTLL